MSPHFDLEKGLEHGVATLIHDDTLQIPPAICRRHQRHGWRRPITFTRRMLKSLPYHKLGVQEIPRRRRRHSWSTFWVSKVGSLLLVLMYFLPAPPDTLTNSRHHHLIDHPSADFVDLPNGFVHGSMSDTDLCQWVFSSARPIQEAVVCNITWWRANKAPFHHQFILLTVIYRRDATAPVELYDLRVERIGKARSFRGAAEHRVTVSTAKHLSHLKLDHTLLFGLLGAEDMVDWETLVTPETFPIQLAFRDELDEKWRGPPATLAQVASYVEHIVLLAPRYNVTSTNCYYFSRLLMHAVALRHYSFQFIAAHDCRDLQPLSKVHDPSAISSVFHFLLEQKRLNGVLVYVKIVRLIHWLIFLILLACLAAYIRVAAVLCKGSSFGRVIALVFVAWIFLLPWVCALFCSPLLDTVRAFLIRPYQIDLDRQTTHLIHALGKSEFAHMNKNIVVQSSRLYASWCR